MKTNSFRHEDQKYGNNRIIRLLTGFPENLSLPCRYEHGHVFGDQKPTNDLRTKKRIMLVYNKRRLDIWNRYSKKNAVILGSPFVHFRRLMDIKQSSDAKGTIAFPCHSKATEIGTFDRKAYCNALHNLPAKFHPIKVCLHEHDAYHGFDQIYRDAGMEIVTAGKREDPQFPDHFYQLLSSTQYATSNWVGSYLIYAVEMGVPFFMYGPEAPVFKRKKTKQITTPRSQYIEEFTKMFSTYPNVTITDEQAQLVRQEAGMDDAICPEELHDLLLRTYPAQHRSDELYFYLRHPKRIFRDLWSVVRPSGASK